MESQFPILYFNFTLNGIGDRNAYQNLMEGKLIKPEEALNIGLVDEVVDEAEVLSSAKQKMKQYLSFNKSAWKLTKQNIKRDLINMTNPKNITEIEATLKLWWSPEVRAMLKQFVDRFKEITF